MQSYMLIHNVSKNSNIGTIARSCTAMGASGIVVVGTGKKRLRTFGSHGADKHLNVTQLPSLTDAKNWFLTRNVTVCGIEIMDEAKPVSNQPFRGSTAFVLGNEGSGLSAAEKAICDHFVYIPQYGSGTASLNVATAGAIVLHHFALWANFKEQQRQGEKFIVADVKRRFVDGEPFELTEEELLVRERRAALRQANMSLKNESDDNDSPKESS